MKIVCPSCEASYQVPEAVLESKRQVRCAKCGNSWVPGDQPRIPDDTADSLGGAGAEPATAHTPAAAESAYAAATPSAPAEPPATVAAAPAPAAPMPSGPMPAGPMPAGLAPAATVPPIVASPVYAPEPEPAAVYAAAIMAEAAAKAAEAILANPIEDPAPRSVETAPAPVLTATPDAAAAPRPTADPAEAPQAAPLAGWIASLVVLTAIFVTFVVLRDPIMQAWPASTRLYAAIGLYHP